MTLLPLLLPAALAQAAPQADLDGDGKVDPIAISEEGVTIGGVAVPCGGMELCTVALHDISSQDSYREVALTEVGPRDDKSVSLYRYKGGQLVALSFRQPADGEWPSTPSAITTSGNGIVLADFWQRTYTRRDKYLARGDALEYVRQPFWHVGYELPVDRSVAIVRTIGGGEVVANVRPGSQVTILLESAEHPEWFLLRISSGLTGWVHLPALQAASDQLMAVYGAG